jgi:type I restriction enzyme R subunit
MPDLPPEQRARQQIDAQLTACGWVIQDYKSMNLGAARGIALRNVPLKSA